MEREVDVAILGAGTAGLNAMGQVRQVTTNFVLINGGELGTTCARVGCMPSKALIQVAEDYHRKALFPRMGIEGGEKLSVDPAAVMEHVRDLRDILVDRLLSKTTDTMGDKFIEGYGQIIGPNQIKVGDLLVEAKKIIIATGSRPLVPEPWKRFGDRVLTTDLLFEQETLPGSLAVVGLGAIGLELGQSLARLGVEVHGFEMADKIGGVRDPEVNRTALDLISRDFPIHLGEAAALSEAEEGKIRVTAGGVSITVDRILASLGRTPNVERLGLENLGLVTTDKGLPDYDPHTMQVGDLPLFIAGDANGDRQILHEAGDEGRSAGYNAVHDPVTPFARKPRMAITFSDPNLCEVGAPLSELDEQETVIGEFQFGPLGRGLVMGRNRGLLRLYADRSSGKLTGASMVAHRGENLAHLIALMIQQEMTALEALRTPFYHPVVEEALQGALRDLLANLGTTTNTPADLIPL